MTTVEVLEDLKAQIHDVVLESSGVLIVRPEEMVAATFMRLAGTAQNLINAIAVAAESAVNTSLELARMLEELKASMQEEQVQPNANEEPDAVEVRNGSDPDATQIIEVVCGTDELVGDAAHSEDSAS